MKAKITEFKKNGLTLSFAGKTFHCPLVKLNLCKQHKLDAIFSIGAEYNIKEIEDNVCIPVFKHPHDQWIRLNPCGLCYEDIITDVQNQNIDKVLSVVTVKLDDNVFATAESSDRTHQQGELTFFVPKFYNSKTKEIFGYVD